MDFLIQSKSSERRTQRKDKRAESITLVFCYKRREGKVIHVYKKTVKSMG